MKASNAIPRFLVVMTLFAALIFTGAIANALTSGETYTITVQKIDSDGTLNSNTSSDSATADSDGKVSFSLSGIPDNSSCNFLLITIKDSNDNTVRRSISPCPNSGESLPVGVSSLTNSQTEALLAALESAGTDDPILAVFGFVVVRSTSATSSELIFMADLVNQGINNSGGFIDYLTSNGVTSTQIATYKSSIVSRLADNSSGYSKFIKDSVDASTDAEKLNARGEAASKLLLVLVEAATTAGFSQDRVLEAFNGMGAIVVPLMDTGVTNGDISSATSKMIDSSIGGGIQKLKADKDIEKYSTALTTLGASGDDVTNYQSAANTLLNTMVSAFQAFEQVFNGSETESEIQAVQTTFEATMQTAFEKFMTDTAASDSRVSTMVSNINAEAPSAVSAADFKFYTSNGSQVNWPVTMAVIVDWVSSISANGGGMTYTPDNTTIPSNMTWLGTCSVSGNYDKSSCLGASGDWTPGRTDFESQGIPTSYASIFAIQEDIMILEFVRWGSQESAGNDMSAQETLEKSFSDSVAALSNNIGGTTDGSTAISSTLKSAVITLLKSPQF
ncbi:MAG TPA: hypothetical protein ENH01_03690 [Nitrospirae bacterium]|nr:hypothetical protein [Nitrospirota bacterium]